ncbi:hypothetical protein B296_00015048 [Ensete ventricosum]|uniref:Uncharacterized protein n=1 Tax=Ensete ventricosum TaxID=4639 RepID=A0A426XZY7_ENSVE|nr:hypothetical protein B296_00015048 [Ensete ventricosum]
MRLGTCMECIGNWLRVSGACQDGAKEFVGRRSRLDRRLLGIAEKHAGSDGWTAQADDCTTRILFSGWLSTVGLLASTVVPLVPNFFGCV